MALAWASEHLSRITAPALVLDETTMADLNSDLAAEREANRQLRLQLEGYDQALARLSAEMNELAQALKAARATERTQAEFLRQTQQQLQMIWQSHSWRLMEPLRKVRAWLRPQR